MTADDVLLEAEEKMIKTEQVIQNEFAGVRTGKASPALVENIVVEAYGAQMRLRELASITTPEPRMILIQPYDPSTVTAIEKAIQKSNLGVNPVVQGKVIRIVLPELSQERRMELDKLVKKMAEDGRVAIRNVRREALDHLKKILKEHKISEDDFKVYEKDLQKLTDDYIKKIDEHLAKKEKEIMTI
ncbi:MAG: ribosome recycling factor [Verrucomicrobiia bacterium]|jgi:ribosome recycling factor